MAKKLSVSTRGTGRRPSRPKYNAQGRREDGHWFASKSEAERYLQLKEMLAQGLIDKLELQPEYKLFVKGVHICSYRGDFRYAVIDRGLVQDVILEDVKGMITDVYVIKKKMVEAEYGIKINEIPASKVKDWAGRYPQKQ